MIADITASNRVPGPTYAEVRDELDAAAADRARFDPQRVRKGNMTEEQAEWRRRILGAMYDDIGRIIERTGTCTENHNFTWADRRAELLREIAFRRHEFPRRVRAGDLDQATADLRFLRLQAALAIYDDGFDFPINPQDKRPRHEQWRPAQAAIGAEAAAVRARLAMEERDTSHG